MVVMDFVGMAKKWQFPLFKNIPAREKRITVSTLFTLLRICLVPFVVGCMIAGFWGYALSLFLMASVSDVIDGTLARWWNDQTFLGACLDPIADKLLVVSSFCALAFVQSPLFVIPLWFVIFVLIKELIVLIGVAFVYWFKGGLVIEPTVLGKSAAILQMSFIIWVLACYFFEWMPTALYYWILLFMACVILGALIQYFYMGFKQLVKDD